VFIAAFARSVAAARHAATTRAIIYNDGRWWLAIFDGNKAIIKMELRSESGWTLLRSLVEMLAPGTLGPSI
jgi:hypothetical protein